MAGKYEIESGVWTVKYNRRLKSILVLAAVLVTSCFTYVLPVEAGQLTNVIDTSSVDKEINSAYWNNVDDDVSAEEGVIVFPEESTEDTKLITRNLARVAEGVESLVEMRANLKFDKLPENEKFVLAFGLSSIAASIGEAGNLEIIFENKGGLKLSVIAYSQDGEAVELLKEKAAGSLSGTDVKIVISTNQKLTLRVGSSQIYQGDIPFMPEGRIGFLQTGSCAARVRDIYIETYQYERPENCDIYEDFEDGEFNANLLTSVLRASRSNSDSPAVLGIDEINGNHAFRFYQVTTGYIGTMYDYSNFEMSFDVPYLRRNVELDEDGKQVEARSNDMIVAFGLTGNTFSNDMWTGGPEYLLFTRRNTIATYTGHTASVASNYPFFDGPNDKGFSVKLRVMDGQVTVYLKWMEETEWTQVMNYSFTTPTGTISIWTAGGDYAIDNLKIVNKDSQPNLIDVEYKSNVLKNTGDWEYEPTEKVYAEKKVVEEDGFSWYVLIPIAIGVCILEIAVTQIIKKVKNRKKKEGNKFEE